MILRKGHEYTKKRLKEKKNYKYTWPKGEECNITDTRD